MVSVDVKRHFTYLLYISLCSAFPTTAGLPPTKGLYFSYCTYRPPRGCTSAIVPTAHQGVVLQLLYLPPTKGLYFSYCTYRPPRGCTSAIVPTAHQGVVLQLLYLPPTKGLYFSYCTCVLGKTHRSSSRLAEVFSALPLKQFQCSSDRRYHPFSSFPRRLCRALLLSTLFPPGRSMVWRLWLCARRQCLKLLNTSYPLRHKPHTMLALPARSGPLTLACPGCRLSVWVQHWRSPKNGNLWSLLEVRLHFCPPPPPTTPPQPHPPLPTVKSLYNWSNNCRTEATPTALRLVVNPKRNQERSGTVEDSPTTSCLS